MRITINNDDELNEHFVGVVIEVSDFSTYFVPGWECKHCGWRIGTLRLPPSHMCPDDGNRQKGSDE